MNDPQRQTVGPWTLGERLGRGGNATVWTATRSGSTTAVALKLIKTTKVEREPYQRFVREIEFLRDHQDIPGLRPLLDTHLPDQPDKTDQPWLAMPIATPIAQALEGRLLADVVAAAAAIADTLARLQHKSGIAHRDIKPGSLYELNGRWLIGDFGLIAVPDAENLTQDGRQVGPAHYMAYEMILNPATADPRPADVYSLGKTRWVLATGQAFPPEGHQPTGTRGFGIGDFHPHPKAASQAIPTSAQDTRYFSLIACLPSAEVRFQRDVVSMELLPQILGVLGPPSGPDTGRMAGRCGIAVGAREDPPAGQQLPGTVRVAGMLTLSCLISQTGQITVTFAGELDATSADQAYGYVRGAIDAHGGEVLLDVAGLSFCDARGLRALARMSRHAGQAGSSMQLVAPPPPLVKIIRITGLEDKLPVHRGDRARHVQGTRPVRDVAAWTRDVLRRPPGPRRRAGRPMFELDGSKLRRPVAGPGGVRRVALADRLRGGGSFPVVSVVAPAGYGKTTLLAQWAEGNGQAFAWVSLDERDNDPKVLLSYVAEALDAVEPIDKRVFDALASPDSSVPGSVVPRLGAALASMTCPVALVLDDVHVLHDPGCRAALPVLADHVPDGSQLVLSGRDAPPLPVPRLRAAGKMLEIGPRDLALTLAEAGSLLREAGITLGPEDVAELHGRAEGWPAGLYLAALSLRNGGSLKEAVASFTGEHELVSRYMETEFLARISAGQRVFLTRTAVLERMSGPLCDTVLDQPGAAATLTGLARSNLLLVPLDWQGEWYRYHQLFRDLLLAELRRAEPDLIAVLQRRAAGWCTANGLPEEALEYAMAAGDADTAAGLAADLVVRARRQGRVGTVDRWLGWLDERGAIEQQLMLTALAGVMAALAGRAAEAERWADAADRSQDGAASGSEDLAAGAWADVLRALLCRGGVEQMRADADDAVSRFMAAGIAAPPVLVVLQGIARVLSGDLDGGDTFLADAVARAEGVDLRQTVAALCERSLVAMARGEWDRAGALAERAGIMSSQSPLEDTVLTPLLGAVQARIALHRGDVPAARQALAGAQRARHELTCALPHLAVQARIELARACIMLTDLAGARTLTREIDEVLRRRPGLGTLAGQAQELRARLSRLRGPDAPGASALTAAELRLLPLLAACLSLREIAAQLSLSRATVKTQATSIYRKLGASTRSQAVTRARDLGLLDR